MLIPLDGSKEAEAVIPLVQRELAPDARVILFQVRSPVRTMAGAEPMQASLADEVWADWDERAASSALDYLYGAVQRHGAVQRFGGDQERWRCEIVAASSISRAIVDCAAREKVDLIAMYTHDRKGLARLIMGSIAHDVERKTDIRVKVFKPRELVGAV